MIDDASFASAMSIIYDKSSDEIDNGTSANKFFFSVKAFIHQPGMYDIELKKGHTFRSAISSSS